MFAFMSEQMLHTQAMKLLVDDANPTTAEQTAQTTQVNASQTNPLSAGHRRHLALQQHLAMWGGLAGTGRTNAQHPSSSEAAPSSSSSSSSSRSAAVLASDAEDVGGTGLEAASEKTFGDKKSSDKGIISGKSFGEKAFGAKSAKTTAKKSTKQQADREDAQSGEEGEPQRGRGTSWRIRQNEAEERFIQGELEPRVHRRDYWHERRQQEIIPVELPPIFALTVLAARTAPANAQDKQVKKDGKAANKKGFRPAAPKTAAMTANQASDTLSHTSSSDTSTPAITLQPKPHPNVQANVQAVRDGLAAVLGQQNLVERNVRLVCAVSGGVDSMVMLDALAALATRYGLVVTVAHCNHRLRGEASEQDMEFVIQAAKRYGFSVYAASVDVAAYAEEKRLSVETAARALRYQFFEFVAYKASAHAVMTAHTMDDSVETFMMNLLRGSGLTGLAGIVRARPLGQHSTLVRPLLDFRKQELVDYANASGLQWREDASNALTQYTRNKIRHELLPMLETEYSSAFMDVVQRTSHLLREADVLISKTAERALVPILENAETYHQQYLALNIEPLTGHSRFMQGELVHRAVQAKFEAQFGQMLLSFDAVERVLSLVDAPFSTKADLNKYLYAVRDRESILIAPKLPIHNLNVHVEKNKEYDFGGWRIILREVERKSIRFTADPAVEYFDSDTLPYRLTLRTWQHGDSFQPFGMKGHTVKVSDYLTNSKTSFIQRQHALVLTAGSEIVWLCGMRMAEKFKVHGGTRRILRVEYRPKKQPPSQMLHSSPSELALPR